VVLKRTTVTSFFVLTAALVSAVVGDALVEGLSNTDLLWRGHFTDRSSIDLLPVALLASAMLIALFACVVLRQARESGTSTRSLILSSARLLRKRTVAKLLPVIFGLQFAVLFAMETIEQRVVYGHILGGTLWLGGPIAVSVLIHALLGVVCAFLIAGTVQRTAARLMRFVSAIIARYVTIVRTSASCVVRTERILFAPQLRVRAAVVDRGPPRTALG